MEKMTEIIVRVLNGEASPSDKQTLITWLNESRENKENFKKLESVWNAISIIDKSGEFDHEKAFLKFRQEVELKLKASKKARLFRISDYIIRVAAVAVILIGIGYLIFSGTEKHVTSAIAKCEIISPRGSKTQVILPDNSVVWLNSESKLVYNNEYGIEEREVFLEGEGYFEVQTNPDQVFVVNTAGLRIKALGTTFNVKSYASDNTIETTLIEGKVDLENITSGKPATLVSLVPNQKVTYYKVTEETDKQERATGITRENADAATVKNISPLISNEEVDVSLVTSWTNNMIFFDHETFQDLAVRLERRFGVNIYFIDDGIKNLEFTGKFSDIIIEQVLAALQFASPFYYQLYDKDIYISEKPILKKPSQETILN
jgi:ferric-dicitrate binding protein FerR (iron transport regulator)